MDIIKKKAKKRNYLIKMLSKEYLNKKAQLNVIGGKKRKKRKLRFKYIFIYDLLKAFHKKKQFQIKKGRLLKNPKKKFIFDPKELGESEIKFRKNYIKKYLRQQRRLKNKKQKKISDKISYEEMRGKKKRKNFPKYIIIRKNKLFKHKEKEKKIINISFKSYAKVKINEKKKHLQKRLIQLQPTFWQNQFYTRYYIRYGMHIGRGHRFRMREIEDGFVGRYFNLFKTSLYNAAHNILMIRAGLNFLTNALVMGSRLLIISWSRPFFYIPAKIYKYHYFFIGPWKPGSLGNFRLTRQHVKFWHKTPFVPQKGGLGKRRVAKIFNLATLGIKAYPNMMFGFDSSQLNARAVREALFSRMPSIFFYNQNEDLNLNMTYYPIQGTTSKYFSGVFLICYVQNIIAYSIGMRTAFHI